MGVAMECLKMDELDKELAALKKRERAALETHYFARAQLELVRSHIDALEHLISSKRQGQLTFDDVRPGCPD